MKKFFIFLAVISLCMGTVFARVATSSSLISVNGTDTQPLGDMKIIAVKHASDLKPSDQGGVAGLCQYYDSMAALEDDLGIDLLSTPYADDNPYAIFRYGTDDENWHVIEGIAYIVGDVQMGEKLANLNAYDYESGEEFISPINLLIEMIGSANQFALGFDHDYLGEFRPLESYESSGGYRVNILQSAMGADVPQLTAIYVVDGIRYTLSGHVSVQTMKEIIASQK